MSQNSWDVRASRTRTTSSTPSRRSTTSGRQRHRRLRRSTASPTTATRRSASGSSRTRSASTPTALQRPATVGDVLILSDFTNGGDLSHGHALRVDRQRPDARRRAASGVRAPARTTTGCAIANTDDADRAVAVPPKQGESGIFPPGQLLRGRHQPRRRLPERRACFSTFLAETRSSTSETARAQGLRPRRASRPASRRTSRPRSSRTARTSAASTRASRSSTSRPSAAPTGPVTGTVEFFVCGPGSSKPDCSNGGTQRRQARPSAMARQPRTPFTPDRARLVLLPRRVHARRRRAVPRRRAHQQHDRVLPGHPGRRPDRQDAEQRQRSAGSRLSFTLSWANEGEGNATGVVVTDTLPDDRRPELVHQRLHGHRLDLHAQRGRRPDLQRRHDRRQPELPERRRRSTARSRSRARRPAPPAARSTTPARSRRATTAPTPTRARSPSCARMSRSRRRRTAARSTPARRRPSRSSSRTSARAPPRA